MHRIQFRRSASEPAEGAHKALQTPYLDIRGPISKGGERGREGGEKWGREGMGRARAPPDS